MKKEEAAPPDPTDFKERLWIVTKLATNPILGMIFQQLVQLINTYYVGHLNNAALLAGVGMGNMLINVLAYSIMQGLNGSIETLVSQSYGASKNEQKSLRYQNDMKK